MKFGNCKKCGISFERATLLAMLYELGASGTAGYCEDETYKHDFEVLKNET